MSQIRSASAAALAGKAGQAPRSWRGRVSDCARVTIMNPFVEFVIFSLITFDAVNIGIETQVVSRCHCETPLVFKILAVFFAAVFLVELVLRLVAFGHAFFHNGDRLWNWLDLFVVVFSVLDVFTSG